MSKRRVMVVEDDPMSRRLMGDLLGATGFEVTSFESAESAFVAMRKQLPDLLLMDIRLPGMDGFAALSALRENAQTRLLPVIAVTASVMLNERDKILRAGFNAYHPKPIQMAELLKLIDQTLTDPPQPMEKTS
jgi:two-component system, cell cycle response regulator DivK